MLLAIIYACTYMHATKTSFPKSHVICVLTDVIPNAKVMGNANRASIDLILFRVQVVLFSGRIVYWLA